VQLRASARRGRVEPICGGCRQGELDVLINVAASPVHAAVLAVAETFAADIAGPKLRL
jgi:hypothetical protein